VPRGEHLQHGDKVLGKHRFLLPGRGGVGVAGAGEHGGDKAILAVEREPWRCVEDAGLLSKDMLQHDDIPIASDEPDELVDQDDEEQEEQDARS
jgi:hypothetical protein